MHICKTTWLKFLHWNLPKPNNVLFPLNASPFSWSRFYPFRIACGKLRLLPIMTYHSANVTGARSLLSLRSSLLRPSWFPFSAARVLRTTASTSPSFPAQNDPALSAYIKERPPPQVMGFVTSLDATSNLATKGASHGFLLSGLSKCHTSMMIAKPMLFFVQALQVSFFSCTHTTDYRFDVIQFPH